MKAYKLSTIPCPVVQYTVIVTKPTTWYLLANPNLGRWPEEGKSGFITTMWLLSLLLPGCSSCRVADSVCLCNHSARRVDVVFLVPCKVKDWDWFGGGPEF